MNIFWLFAGWRSILWEMVGSGGYIFAGGGWWLVDGGWWWWVVVDIFWLVVGRGGLWWVVSQFSLTLNFNYNISKIYKTASNKLHALARVSHYMDEVKRRILFNSNFLSQFNYCPLI